MTTLLNPKKIQALGINPETIEIWVRGEMRLEKARTDAGNLKWFLFVNGSFHKAFSRMDDETKKWFGVC